MFRTSFAPTASSESQYRRAMAASARLQSAARRGPGACSRPAPTICMATLERIAADIGSSSAALDQQLDGTPAVWPDFAADDLFYANKGRLYAYYLLLRALERGLRQRDRRARPRSGLGGRCWRASATAAELQPWVVVNGAPDSQAAAQPPRRAGVLPAARRAPSSGKSPTSCLNNRSGGSWAAQRGASIGRCCRLNGGAPCAMVEACAAERPDRRDWPAA